MEYLGNIHTTHKSSWRIERLTATMIVGRHITGPRHARSFTRPAWAPFTHNFLIARTCVRKYVSCAYACLDAYTRGFHARLRGFLGNARVRPSSLSRKGRYRDCGFCNASVSYAIAGSLACMIARSIGRAI